MFKEFRVVKKLVEETLKDYPETRNSDRILYLKIMERFGLILSGEQRKKFMGMPVNFESVRRSRQKIQNEEGKYKPSEGMIKKRKNEQRAMQGEVLSEDEKMRRFSQDVLV